MVALDALRALSARLGADPLLVQAAGGNTSQKHDGVMWIKASGMWLRDAATRDVFVPVDHPGLLRALADDDPACETCTAFVRTDLNATGLRPSIETTVHALMPQAVVVHVHCVNTLAWAIRTDAEACLAERLADVPWTFIPYARPGLPLARAIATRLRPGVDVLVLGNHGLVVAADTVAAAATRLAEVVARLSREVRRAVAPDRQRLAAACAGTAYLPADDDETHALATDALALTRGGQEVFYPDHVVFLGTRVATDLASRAPVVAIPGSGVVVRGDASPAAAAMARCLADVMRRVAADDPLRPLTPEDVGRLVHWDAEKYRQTLVP